LFNKVLINNARNLFCEERRTVWRKKQKEGTRGGKADKEKAKLNLDVP
jgi:hypothetical protein